jgi:hypothetical protein
MTSQRLAIAAHLHVALRRRTGRVTDTEWMATNLEYATEIIRFARAKALEGGHADLALWARKLEALMQDMPVVKKPLISRSPHSGWSESEQQRLESMREAAENARNAGFENSVQGSEPGFLESTMDADAPRRRRDPDAPRYVGGIR